MTDTKHPDALRQADRIKSSGQFTNLGELDASAAELHCLHAENVALQQGYDAARLEIDYLRGVTQSKLLAQPVAWMVYLPSIDTQHLYYSQEDMGYVDDVTNHADAEVTPLYEMAAPKAEVAPAGEYPAITTEFINKHAHPSQAAKLCRADWSGKDESSVETVHPEVIKLLHAYADADRAMRAQAAPQADSQPAPVLGTIAHVGTGKTTLTGAITSALRAASTEADNVTAPAGGAVVTDDMVLAALRMQYPGAYGQYLRHPANGPKTSLRTESEIDTARRMIVAALSAAPTPPAQAAPSMADAFIDIRELDANTLRDISVKSGVIWPEDGDRESRLFRFRVRRIATEAYRRGVADGQKINAAVAVMFGEQPHD